MSGSDRLDDGEGQDRHGEDVYGFEPPMDVVALLVDEPGHHVTHHPECDGGRGGNGPAGLAPCGQPCGRNEQPDRSVTGQMRGVRVAAQTAERIEPEQPRHRERKLDDRHGE